MLRASSYTIVLIAILVVPSVLVYLYWVVRYWRFFVDDEGVHMGNRPSDVLRWRDIKRVSGFKYLESQLGSLSG
jgi:hypothetical protein